MAQVTTDSKPGKSGVVTDGKLVAWMSFPVKATQETSLRARSATAHQRF
jgi:hypothetical protein